MSRFGLLVAVFLMGCSLASTSLARTPVLYIVGDSTVESRDGAGSDDQQGWGGKIDKYFSSKINVENHAIGGRSSRSFRNEGRWQAILDELEAGDFVLIQFGHNDGGGLSKDNGRTALKGMGDETRDVTHEETGETEAVHTFGWYMKAYVREAREKGATVVVCSLVPRNKWNDKGKVGRASNDYGLWAKEAAKEEQGWFIDLNAIVADQYDKVGDVEEVHDLYFADEHTHTNRKGAELNAECLIAGLRGQRNCPLYKYLNNKGMKIKPYRD